MLVKKQIKKIFLFLSGLGLLVLCYTLLEPYMLTVRSYKIPHDKLAGIKIAFATDFHFGTNPIETYRAEKILRQIKMQNADLVLLGGDYVNGHNKTSVMSEEKIISFLQQLPKPVYAVLGNHDSYYGKADVLQIFQAAQIPVLDNQNQKLTIKDQKISIAGIADYYTDTPDISKALAKAENMVILLTHTPDVLGQNNIKADLILAGHTHGGQVVLPLVGAPLVPLENDKKYNHGLFYKDQTPLIVSSGLGTSLLPIRFNVLPEIVVIEFE